MKPLIDTGDLELLDAAERYLQTKNPSTAASYRSLKRFRAYLARPLEEFIKKVERIRLENRDKPVIERERYAEDTVRGYMAWMKDRGEDHKPRESPYKSY